MAALGLVLAGLQGAPVAFAGPPSPPSGAPSVTDTSVPVIPVAPAPQTPGPQTPAPQAPAGKTQAGQRSEATVAKQVIAQVPSRTTTAFNALAVTWKRGATTTTLDNASIQVRTRSATTGAWTGWSTLTPDEWSGGTDAPSRAGTDLLWTDGESNGLQVQVTDASSGTSSATPAAKQTLDDVQVSLINSPEVASDANLQATAAQAATQSTGGTKVVPRPAIISRSGWGADESMRTSCDSGPDDTIYGAVIHHTAGTNDYTKAQSASIIRGIMAYHIKSRGFCDIAYNFLVDKYGQIFQGRCCDLTIPVHGAHALDWNTETVGVAFMGNFDTATPTSAMLTAGEKLVAWKLSGYYRDPTGTVTLAGKKLNVIFQHKDVYATSCPGTNVSSQMPAFRTAVKKTMGTGTSPIRQWYEKQGGESSSIGKVYRMEQPIGGGAWVEFSNAFAFYHVNYQVTYLKSASRTKLLQLGNVTGSLGWLTTSEAYTANRTSLVSRFQYGAIFNSPRGAHVITGSMAHRYQLRGEDNGVLGRLGSDPRQAGDGSQWQSFDKGYITYSAAAGAHTLRGTFATQWNGFTTAQRSYYGLATTDETHLTRGWKQVHLHAAMYNFAGNQTVVPGGFWTAYQKLGAETGRLGYPTSGQYGVAGVGQAMDFEHGTLTMSKATGAVSVTYR